MPKKILKMHHAEYHFNREMVYKMKKRKANNFRITNRLRPDMRLHRNVALGILLGLENVLIKKRSASEVLKKLLRSNRSWGRKRPGTIGKIFYDIIRQKLFLKL